VLHEADAGLEIEGAGNGERGAGNGYLGGSGFRAEAMEQIDEGGERSDVVERACGGPDQLEIAEPAEARADVTAADIVRQNTIETFRDHVLSAFQDCLKNTLCSWLRQPAAQFCAQTFAGEKSM
jgi:hypothetical protein